MSELCIDQDTVNLLININNNYTAISKDVQSLRDAITIAKAASLQADTMFDTLENRITAIETNIETIKSSMSNFTRVIDNLQEINSTQNEQIALTARENIEAISKANKENSQLIFRIMQTESRKSWAMIGIVIISIISVITKEAINYFSGG